MLIEVVTIMEEQFTFMHLMLETEGFVQTDGTGVKVHYAQVDTIEVELIESIAHGKQHDFATITIAAIVAVCKVDVNFCTMGETV
jgi:hypothetical protein